MSKKKIIIPIIIVVLIIAVTVFLLLHFNVFKKSNNQDNKVKENEIQAKSKSFGYMKLNKDNLNLSEEEKLVLEYFDYSSLYINTSMNDAISRYPNLFKGLDVEVYAEVVKILSSDDKEYKALVQIYNPHIYSYKENEYLVVKGKHQLNRFKVGDEITFLGKYTGNELVELPRSGKSADLNVITVDKWLTGESEFTDDEVRTIAKNIFGENIKFGKVDGCAYNAYCEDYPFSSYHQVAGLKIKLEDPKNSNYTVFNMFNTGNMLEVGYCTPDNFMEKCSDGLPQIYLAADFKHFIVVTYEKSTDTSYIEYYDNQFNKIWRREIDKEGKKDYDYYGYMDYTDKEITLVLDGYLYIMNIEDGKDVIEPVLIGKDHSVIMYPEYMLLTGYTRKDFIMLMDYTGKILKKVDIKESKINEIDNFAIRKINDDIIITFFGREKENSYENYARIIKLDKDFSIIAESEDITINE